MAEYKYKPSVTIQGLHNSKSTYQGNMTKAILIGPLTLGVLIAIIAMYANPKNTITDKSIFTDDVKIVDIPKGSKDGSYKKSQARKSMKSLGALIPAMLGKKHSGVFDASKMVITKDDGTRYTAQGSIVVSTTVAQTLRSSQLTEDQLQYLVDVAFIPAENGEDHLTFYGSDDDFGNGLPNGELTFLDPQFDDPITINFGDIDGSDIAPLIDPDHGVLVDNRSVMKNQPIFRSLKPSENYGQAGFFIIIDKKGNIVEIERDPKFKPPKGMWGDIEDVMRYWRFTPSRIKGEFYSTKFHLVFEYNAGLPPVVEVRKLKKSSSETTSPGKLTKR